MDVSPHESCPAAAAAAATASHCQVCLISVGSVQAQHISQGSGKRSTVAVEQQRLPPSHCVAAAASMAAAAVATAVVDGVILVSIFNTDMDTQSPLQALKSPKTLVLCCCCRCRQQLFMLLVLLFLAAQ